MCLGPAQPTAHTSAAASNSSRAWFSMSWAGATVGCAGLGWFVLASVLMSLLVVGEGQGGARGGEEDASSGLLELETGLLSAWETPSKNEGGMSLNTLSISAVVDAASSVIAGGCMSEWEKRRWGRKARKAVIVGGKARKVQGDWTLGEGEPHDNARQVRTTDALVRGIRCASREGLLGQSTGGPSRGAPACRYMFINHAR